MSTVTSTPAKRGLARSVAGVFTGQPFSFYAAIVLLSATAAVALLTPLLPSYDPYGQDLFAGYLEPFQTADGPSGKFYLLGADALGRDYLSRIAVATRVSGFIGLAAVAISLVIGVTLGLVAGFFRGPLEQAIMGLADLQLAIPRILLLIAVTAVVGPSILNLTLLLGFTSWVSYGRVARAMALSLREREFVLSAKTQGASWRWNIWHHLLPNVLPQMIIVGSYELGTIIIIESSISYLGLGIQPPLPSLGLMIAEGQSYLQLNPWMAVLPGIVLFMMIAGVQFFSQRFTSEGRAQSFGG
ncbi:hypothetical protein DLJ53_24835 [Acuticoccus sediminis]|uniref:ABC transmembrane type-1 domain-containing protein n=1 Tax=Acuticoccus sediminis TaxID=2184697 RepID=A0A8B2NTE8_9HYPH|nr:ABC transporter permease [Acuticoccus sediminis]RAH98863.1 hypothetical protein DLJ53_24835 [Acuticoccus sediminis]